MLGALPRRRPHRRSQKRPASPGRPGNDAVIDVAQSKPASRRAGANGAAESTRSPADASRPTENTRPSAKVARVAPKPRPTAPGKPTAGRRTERLRQPAQPGGVPPTPAGGRPVQPIGRDILGTAAQAAGELAEIGLSISARALRNAVARLPRP